MPPNPRDRVDLNAGWLFVRDDVSGADPFGFTANVEWQLHELTRARRRSSSI